MATSPRKLHGLSEEVTMAVLPRLYMEELTLELRRRDINMGGYSISKDHIVSVLRDVMAQEYSELGQRQNQVHEAGNDKPSETEADQPPPVQISSYYSMAKESPEGVVESTPTAHSVTEARSGDKTERISMTAEKPTGITGSPCREAATGCDVAPDNSISCGEGNVPSENDRRLTAESTTPRASTGSIGTAAVRTSPGLRNKILDTLPNDVRCNLQFREARVVVERLEYQNSAIPFTSTGHGETSTTAVSHMSSNFGTNPIDAQSDNAIAKYHTQFREARVVLHKLEDQRSQEMQTSSPGTSSMPQFEEKSMDKDGGHTASNEENNKTASHALVEQAEQLGYYKTTLRWNTIIQSTLHPEKKVYTCKMCEFTTSAKSELVSHRRIHRKHKGMTLRKRMARSSSEAKQNVGRPRIGKKISNVGKTLWKASRTAIRVAARRASDRKVSSNGKRVIRRTSSRRKGPTNANGKRVNGETSKEERTTNKAKRPVGRPPSVGKASNKQKRPVGRPSCVGKASNKGKRVAGGYNGGKASKRGKSVVTRSSDGKAFKEEKRRFGGCVGKVSNKGKSVVGACIDGKGNSGVGGSSDENVSNSNICLDNKGASSTGKGCGNGASAAGRTTSGGKTVGLRTSGDGNATDKGKTVAGTKGVIGRSYSRGKPSNTEDSMEERTPRVGNREASTKGANTALMHSTVKSEERLIKRTKGKVNVYECGYCKYRTPRKDTIVIHLRMHTGEKPFCCSYCSYKTISKENLQRHTEKNHTGLVTPFQCEYCGYVTGNRSALVKHIRIHTGEKPYVCEYCGYRTTCTSRIREHIRTHTGEKAHHCGQCTYRSIRRDTLVRHYRTHTGDKPFHCMQCDYKSSQKSTLKRHVTLVHGKAKRVEEQEDNVTVKVENSS